MNTPAEKPIAPAVSATDPQLTAIATDLSTQIDTNTSAVIRFGLLVLLLGFGGFIVWATTAPLDEGVPAPGVVTVDTKSKAVQHLTGGIVDSILVREGDFVTVGQPLIILNDVQAKAQLAVLQAQYDTALAVESRLLAEYTGQGEISFNENLLKRQDQPEVRRTMDVQRRLFATRRNSLEQEIAILRKSIEGLSTQVDGMRELAREGYVPRNKMLEIERMYAEMAIRILQRQQEYRKDVENQLTEIRKDSAALREKLLAAEDELKRTRILSPAEGMVVGLTAHTPGGVIRAGETIMSIVPKDEPLVVEAKIATHLINYVHAGLEADLRFVALDPKTTPVIPGHVMTVSADALYDQANHSDYFLARIVVTEEGKKRLGDKKIQPGMPVEVVIKTGSRTFMNYLLKPFLDRLAVSLIER